MSRPLLLAAAIAALCAGFAGDPDGSALLDPGGPLESVTTDNGATRTVRTLTGIVREVTAYNVGVRRQTSRRPCVGAAGDNLCRLVDGGLSVCAANFVPLGTVLHVEEHGECVVLDRMHRRHAHRVDIAMRADEVARAREFGVRNRLVSVKD